MWAIYGSFRGRWMAAQAACAPSVFRCITCIYTTRWGGYVVPLEDRWVWVQGVGSDVGDIWVRKEPGGWYRGIMVRGVAPLGDEWMHTVVALGMRWAIYESTKGWEDGVQRKGG